jgi:trehalose 6-phosphate phosphatase
MPLPFPDRDRSVALFLDLDGTLVEIAPAPDQVRVAPGLPALIETLRDRRGGALAVVSGRPIAQIDALLRPAHVAAAGAHGLERRRADDSVVAAPPSAAIRTVRDRLLPVVAAQPQLVLEDKGVSLSLHYRRAPELEAGCRAAMDAALDGLDLELLDGKMVLEVRPRGMDKGRAITEFLAEPPFAGRLPVFIGDDRTDEDGFARVNAQGGGWSIKVGVGATRATRRVGDVAEVHEWLRAFADRLAR